MVTKIRLGELSTRLSSFDRFVQNLVFYGISQSTGRWLTDPYVAFGAAALVEIVAYFVVHLVLDRWGRKLTFCLFVFSFGIVAFLVTPIELLMEESVDGKTFPRVLEEENFELSSREKKTDVSHQRGVEILRLGFVRDHLHLRQRTFPNANSQFRNGSLLDGGAIRRDYRHVVQRSSRSRLDSFSDPFLRFVVVVGRGFRYDLS